MNPKQAEMALNAVQEVLKREAASIHNIVDTVGESYLDALNLIFESVGKVVVTGMGKSGLIGRKIAATMSSTGTLAIFMHPAEASHGDLGVVQCEDVVLALGKSGESNELNEILPVIKKIGAKIVAITANDQSTLANHADVVLDGGVSSEACPYDLAPTSSTTVALAIGDALAIALMKINEFQPNDFALYHPGGRLGRRLLLHVRDVMIPIEKCSVLNPSSVAMQDIIVALSEKGHGIIIFSNDNKTLSGILTDGDIRRLLEVHGKDIFSLSIESIIVKSPTRIADDVMAVSALKLMEEREKPLNVLPVVSGSTCLGIVRLHELLQVV